MDLETLKKKLAVQNRSRNKRTLELIERVKPQLKKLGWEDEPPKGFWERVIQACGINSFDDRVFYAALSEYMVCPPHCIHESSLRELKDLLEGWDRLTSTPVYPAGTAPFQNSDLKGVYLPYRNLFKPTFYPVLFSCTGGRLVFGAMLEYERLGERQTSLNTIPVTIRRTGNKMYQDIWAVPMNVSADSEDGISKDGVMRVEFNEQGTYIVAPSDRASRMYTCSVKEGYSIFITFKKWLLFIPSGRSEFRPSPVWLYYDKQMPVQELEEEILPSLIPYIPIALEEEEQ